MTARFPHLKNNESDFPYLETVNAYKYDNDFDYSRFDHTQMHLTLCTVPWDVGEAHIGARTISGIGNVVYFGSKEARDAWFNAIPDNECYRFDTKYKELYRDMYVDVPIPFDMCSKHNYLVSEYEVFAHDGSLVEYERYDGHRKWFWFVREVEFIAPNTTRLHLLDDAFQTWIYDITISGMILERGHAPLFSTTADEYLSNPIENNTDLLTEDVNFGEATQVSHIDALALNAGDMYACVATSANPTGAWGAKADDTWKVPASGYYLNNGAPSVYVFAVAVSDLNTLLANIDSYVPQFKQTIQGVFFASDDLISLGTAFTFADVTCYPISSTRKTFDLCTLNKSMFGYSSKYSNIAKLYTSPYAHIEITDENGNPDIIKIEDTTGSIDASVALSLAYPFITIESHLVGVGGNASATVTFKNVNAHTFPISGQWYETLRSWNVPTFAVVQNAATVYDYSTHFDRKQKVVDYNTVYDNTLETAVAVRDDKYESADTVKSNAYANADTVKANTDASVDTEKANADRSADTGKTNADASADNSKAISDATAATNNTNSKNISNRNKSNEDNLADTSVANALIITTANTDTVDICNTNANTARFSNVSLNNDLRDAHQQQTNESATATIQAADQQAAITATAGGVSAAAGALGSVASGDIAGAVSNVINGIMGVGTTLASTSVGNALTAAQASIVSGGIQADTAASNNLININYELQRDNSKKSRDNQNSVTSGTTANSAATQKANALATNTVETTAYDLTKTTENSNSLAQQTTDKANALRLQTMEKANALETQTTDKANALRDYEATIENADRDKARAQSAIDNDIKQAALESPSLFGSFANGDNATTRPIALFAHVVTQSVSAIESAGDEFLRYGYMYDKQWNFSGDWNIGKYFTYWKLRDFWVTNLNVPDMYMDKIRFFLFGGVTIWRKPEYIGKRTIYENFD